MCAVTTASPESADCHAELGEHSRIHSFLDMSIIGEKQPLSYLPVWYNPAAN
jgi:hypothetical protein